MAHHRLQNETRAGWSAFCATGSIGFRSLHGAKLIAYASVERRLMSERLATKLSSGWLESFRRPALARRPGSGS